MRDAPREAQYAATIKFDGPSDAQTVLVQSVVQDIYQVAEDVLQIRSEDVEARFIRDKEPVEPDGRPRVLQWGVAYKSTLSRVTKPDTDAKLYFSLPPTPGAVDKDGKKVKDTDYWSGFVLPIDLDGFPHTGDLVLKERVYLKLNPTINVSQRRVTSVCKVFEFEVPGDSTKKPVAKSGVRPDDESSDEMDSESDDEDTASGQEQAVQTSFANDQQSDFVGRILSKVANSQPNLTPEFIAEQVKMNKHPQDFLIGHGFPSALQDPVEKINNWLQLPSMMLIVLLSPLIGFPYLLERVWMKSLPMMPLSLASLRTPKKTRSSRRVKQLQGILECILRIADIVCTTPHASRSKPYIKLYNAAKAVVQDAAMVIGARLRPVAMAGNEKQLPPTVMTTVQKLRIVSGQFDLAQQLIYPDAKNFTYGPKASLDNQPDAMKLENFVEAELELKSPPGKSLPVFFDLPGSTNVYTNMSLLTPPPPQF
ncbi:hypothetical protein FSARC_14188 [Fusarium sarcochroum]|uniref:Uncharacterized protein n=1 Tax=Fusarium sarcochroum TaxID=1208366 RepID=A0A8H4SVB0_9HYPO|nr:hypothetical protein FSARC_14188 [Fusarium sarcochroum]